MHGVWYGPTCILTFDKNGMMRTELLERYDQRIAGERRVRFMRGDVCLYETTMDRFLELTGQNHAGRSTAR